MLLKAKVYAPEIILNLLPTFWDKLTSNILSFSTSYSLILLPLVSLVHLNNFSLHTLSHYC